MHKGVILLVKASNRDEAVQRAEGFLEDYEGEVWDWYQIGGRWTGLLTNYDPQKDERNIEPCKLCNATGIRTDNVGLAHKMPERVIAEEGHPRNGQTGWCNGCNGVGNAVKWPTQWAAVSDDVLPCSDPRAVGKIAEWSGTWRDRVKSKITTGKERFKGEPRMQEYFNQRETAVAEDHFCFESDVYDIETRSNTPPADFAGYWAVVVDMHN